MLPNTASNTTPFRIKANTDAPATSLTTTVNLDKVDAAGAATGTDSSGVANGTIVSTSKTTTVQEPTLSFNLPTAIGTGGDLKAADQARLHQAACISQRCGQWSRLLRPPALDGALQ